MLVTLIPLFDESMTVKAYSVFAQKESLLLNPLSQSTSINDGATSIPGLDVIDAMGIETLPDSCEIFVPIGNVSIFADIASQCKADPKRIVLLFDTSIPPIDMYINRLKELKKEGFKLAIRKISVADFQNYQEVFSLVDYLLLNNKKIVIDKAKVFFEKLYPNIKLVAGNIENQEVFEQLKNTKGYSLYEGDFYRIPVTRGNNEVTPLKATYLHLLKVVNNSDFEINEAADVIGRDPAITISFLKMVNTVVKTAEITSVRHAAAMLGQKELKKWINTAVAERLYSDKASEITRLSLLRARFAESLAEAFGLGNQSEQLFLMGLFSVLDVILEKPMQEALDTIQVSKSISNALVSGTGFFSEIYSFIKAYESADWSEVSRVLIVKNISLNAVTDAYYDTLRWYRLTTTV